MSEPFIAEIRIFAGNFAPRGWAFCNGQLLPIAQNTALFSLIGTTYGGDGRTTTALPDLQGRSVMHPGRGPGLTDRRLGQKGGVSSVTLAESQIPNHAHSMYLNGSITGDSNNPANKLFAQSAVPEASIYASSSPTQNIDELSPQGGGQAHNNTQPYLGINFIIALVGLYPSRS